MRDPFSPATTGNMVYIPVMGVGNKGAVWVAARGQLFRPLKYQCSNWKDLSNV